MSNQKQSPNILLFIADDLGEDVTKIFESGKVRRMDVHTNHSGSNTDIYGPMKNVTRLLQSGLYFSRAWAQPVCSPSRASILTGTHPWRNDVGCPEGAQLKLGISTLPEQLPSNYVSGLFGKWHLGESSNYRPTNRGWDRFIGTLAGTIDDYESWNVQDSDPDPISGTDSYEEVLTTAYATLRTARDAAQWINAQSSDTPWFATVAFHSPHFPYAMPPDGFTALPGLSEEIKGSDEYLFNMMVQNLDYNIGQLLGTYDCKSDPNAFDSISESKLANTIIIFVGDNGSDSRVAIAESKDKIYEGSISVPMIISDGQAVINAYKGQTAAPRYIPQTRLNFTYDKTVHVVDLYKTIIRLANPAAVKFDVDIDSVDLSDIVTTIAGALVEKRKYNFSQYYKLEPTGALSIRATIRNNDYKLNYIATGTVEGDVTTIEDTDWTFYRYKNGSIPGREDVEKSATDIYKNAFYNTGTKDHVALQELLNELKDNYQPSNTKDSWDTR